VTLLAAALVALVAGSCIATDLPDSEPLSLCRVANLPPTYPLVEVTGNLGAAGIIRCSGVAITPRLVLTRSACLALPSELGGTIPEESSVAYVGGPRTVFPTGRALDPSCAQDGSWFPIEDGAFAARLEEPVQRSSLRVALADASAGDPASGVFGIVGSRATSRCAPDIAVLALDNSLSVGFSPLRLAKATPLGEAVMVVGNATFFASQVKQIAAELGGVASPPFSLVLGAQACPRDLGGGVFAAYGGALVGIIGAASGAGCGDPSGETVATLLAPLERLLLDAAAVVGDDLAVEPDPSDSRQELLRPCEDATD